MIYKRRYIRQCECQVCGKLFFPVRYDAKTCSARCRKRLSRGTPERRYKVTDN